MKKIFPKLGKNPKFCLTKNQTGKTQEKQCWETTNVPDAFIFCPNMGIIQMDKVLEQGIFINESEMSQVEETTKLYLQ